jgi:hypothetical protein
LLFLFLFLFYLLFYLFIVLRLPAYGLDLDTLNPIGIPTDRQIFDTYFPKWVALSLAVDTAGLLIRIDRIVKGTNLIPVHLQDPAPSSDEIESQQDESTKSLYLLRPLSISSIISISRLTFTHSTPTALDPPNSSKLPNSLIFLHSPTHLYFTHSPIDTPKTPRVQTTSNNRWGYRQIKQAGHQKKN